MTNVTTPQQQWESLKCMNYLLMCQAVAKEVWQGASGMLKYLQVHSLKTNWSSILFFLGWIKPLYIKSDCLLVHAYVSNSVLPLGLVFGAYRNN